MTGTGPLIRPMTSADRPALANFPNRVSAGSAIFRFHGSVTVLTDKTLNLLLDLVDGQREAITAVDDRGIAGVARFARDDLDPATAEVAILVADEWQHRGLARQLLRPLAERARSAGIDQRSGTTSHAGLTFARPGRTCGAPILLEVAGTRGENATAARPRERCPPHRSHSPPATAEQRQLR